jgi:two-component system LytT family response regulator
MLARILIADDEPLARERVRDRVRAMAPQAEVREALDGDATLGLIRAWSPDAVFLDIQMPGRDGFAVVGEIGTDRMPPTVFVTAYDAFALRAFEVAAVDYLLKPFDDDRFAEAWRRLEKVHRSGALAGETQRLAALLAAVASGAGAAGAAYVERFLVRIGERTVLVPVQDVRWMQSDGNYVDLHTPNGTHTIRETLTSVEARLDPAKFIRIHRRVIVAIDFIKEMRPWFAGDQILVLRDGTKLRVTRTRREAVSARLGGAS